MEEEEVEELEEELQRRWFINRGKDREQTSPLNLLPTEGKQ